MQEAEFNKTGNYSSRRGTAQTFSTALHPGLGLASTLAQVQHPGKHSAETDKFTFQQHLFFTVILGTEIHFYLTLLLKIS